MAHVSIERLPTGEDPVVLIRNLYTDEELSAMMEELNSIGKLNLLRPGSRTGSAVGGSMGDEGNIKVNFGLWFGEIFPPGKSAVDSIVRNRVFDFALEKALCDIHYIYKYMPAATRVNNKLSYYTNNNDYSTHTDECLLTCLTYLWNQPKQFTGGDLVFPEHGYTYTPEFGDVLIFPSIVVHAVTSVHVTSKESYNGRFVVSTFINRF